MHIKKLTLSNFRNYENAVFNFQDGINILVGDNAQGKTNSAEAVFYLCTGYSPRASKDKQVIRYGEKQAKIAGICSSRFGELEVSIEFKQTKKDVFVNGVKLNKIGELMGNINSVFFNPGELKLIQQSPEDRRRFMDISLSQMDKKYFYTLQKYRKILEQRNDLLKSPDLDTVRETLPLWDRELANSAVEIIEKRKNFISNLEPYVLDYHQKITDGDDIELSLETPHYTGGGVEELITAYAERVEKDLILGYTTVGPHRDDIKIKVNGEDVRVYGSQGQQRTAALALKLGEVCVMKNAFSEYPVLILDDALSELDLGRRKRLIGLLSGFQTIITLTEIPEELASADAKIFKIEKGKIWCAD
ncbi:MAG: DNA replication/repair protein RecF [Clostridia bacterium]|nr:DNA replication/repair protein RecF [Clostridia bacterium]